MLPSIAVIGDSLLQGLISRITQSEGISCFCYSHSEFLAEQPDDRFDQGCIVVLSITKDINNSLDSLNSLRLDKCFRGTVVILSFVTRELIKRKYKAEALEMPGCYYLQLPFLEKDLFRLVLHHAEPSNEEMAQVRRDIGARQIIRSAGAVRHDFENKLSLALAHLREIEKLGYFSNTDLNRIAREIHELNIYLTREKMENFHKQVTNLLTAANKWGEGELPSNTMALNQYWGAIDDWFNLSESLGNELEPKLSEIYNQGKQAQIAIREILSAITKLKEEAQQVMLHAE